MHKPGHFPNASVTTLHQPMTVFESKILPSMMLGQGKMTGVVSLRFHGKAFFTKNHFMALMVVF